jgi:hypothetical protein
VISPATARVAPVPERTVFAGSVVETLHITRNGDKAIS